MRAATISNPTVSPTISSTSPSTSTNSPRTFSSSAEPRHLTSSRSTSPSRHRSRVGPGKLSPTVNTWFGVIPATRTV
eukprot:673797-Rhodomonas_salina.1